MGNLTDDLNRIANDPTKQRKKEVKVKDEKGVVRNYFTDSSEYRKIYDTGRLVGIDKDGTINAVQSPAVEVIAEAPAWLKQARYLASEEANRNAYRNIGANIANPFFEGLKTASEFTGIPGAVRFVKDPVKSLTGVANTLEDIILDSNTMPQNVIAPSEYKPEDVEGLFNTINTVGLLNSALNISKQPIQAASKYVTEGPLKNAYKLNPWAFKPQEGMMYRGIGEEGMKDALESGVFRPAGRSNKKAATFLDDAGNQISLKKSFDKTYYSPDFRIADRYGKGYIAEVPANSADFSRRYNKDWSWLTNKEIPINEGRILQKDWLRGYKPIKTSKQLLKSKYGSKILKYIGGGEVNPPKINQNILNNYIKEKNKYLLEHVFNPTKPMQKSDVENNAQEFLTKMINSPLFEKRYNTMRNKTATPEEIKTMKNSMLDHMEKVQYWPTGYENIKKLWEPDNDAIAHYIKDFEVEKDNYGIPHLSKDLRERWKGYHTIFRKNNSPTATLHELSHASTNSDSIPASINIPYSKISEKKEHVEKFSGPNYERRTEHKAYLDELRKYLYDKNIYDATQKEFDETDYNNLINEFENLKKEIKNNPNNIELQYLENAFEKNILPYDKENTIRLFNSYVNNNNKKDLLKIKYG